MAAGKKGIVISSRPKEYKILPQQNRLKEAAAACGIVKGVSRAELVDKMKHCIPEYFQKLREGEHAKD